MSIFRVRPVRSGSGARVRVGSGPVRVLDRVLSAVMAINTKRACQILPQPRKAKNCSKSSLSGLWTKFKKQPMNKKTCLSDPTIAPQSKELLQKLVFGAADEIPKAANEYKTCLSDPATAPRSKELLQKLAFGAVDGIPKATNQ